jgi:sigma-B regulation protein RsbU (phosphoserine phosphatase)
VLRDLAVALFHGERAAPTLWVESSHEAVSPGQNCSSVARAVSGDSGRCRRLPLLYLRPHAFLWVGSAGADRRRNRVPEGVAVARSQPVARNLFPVGVVPIFLIALALMLAAELVFARFGAQLVRQSVKARTDIVGSAAQNLMLAASHGATQETLDGIRQQVPRLSAVVRAQGQSFRLPRNGEFAAAPAWIPAGFADLLENDGRYYIAADVRDGDTEAFAYLPLDDQVLRTLTPGMVSVVGVLGGESLTTIHFGFSGSRMSVVDRGVRTEIAPSGHERYWSRWDVPIAGMLPWKVLTPTGRADVLLPLASRPSLLVGGGVSDRMSSVAQSILLVVGTFLLVVEAVSLFSSIRLTRTITRSVGDLYRGTQHVSEGDFSYRIPVRGDHQLSGLARSFNGMSTTILQLIGEVRKKEKLDAELRIARDVQLNLFPKSVPKLRTLQMTGVCIPGRIVSGDYYDYVTLDERRTAIALGDVSGKGVSAALLMASVQAALHAHLRFSGASSHASASTATLMTRISQQLYENTPTEKYATFFCSMYDDRTGRLAYTNAGHLKPILVRDRQASPLEGGGIVAGILPDVTYDEQDILLRTGDLLAIFSDGVPEAMNAADQEFGETRLAELLITHCEEPLEDIAQAVTDSVERWIHDPDARDDLTLVLLRKL